MVIFELDNGQELPFWAAVDKVPVKIRVNNYDRENRANSDDVWYINEQGLTEKSRKRVEQHLSNTRNGKK